jgi:hypothetical protein
MGQSQLALSTARIQAREACSEALQQAFQERYFLLNLGESINGNFGAIDYRSAVTLARLVKENLTAEHKFIRAKLRACQQEVLVLQNELEASLVYKHDAERQLEDIQSRLDQEGLFVPKHTFPTLSADYLPVKPCTALCSSRGTPPALDLDWKSCDDSALVGRESRPVSPASSGGDSESVYMSCSSDNGLEITYMI